MPWQPIETAPKTGERVLVGGGLWVRGNRLAVMQSSPSLVMWDGSEWVICDNEGDRSVIRRPRVWFPVPKTAE